MATAMLTKNLWRKACLLICLMTIIAGPTYSTQEYGQSGIFSNLLGDDVSIGYIQG